MVARRGRVNGEVAQHRGWKRADTSKQTRTPIRRPRGTREEGRERGPGGNSRIDTAVEPVRSLPID